MPAISSLYDAADRAADGQLEQILRERRAAGDSFGTIAAHLYREHGISVSHESIRSWCARLEIEQAS